MIIKHGKPQKHSTAPASVTEHLPMTIPQEAPLVPVSTANPYQGVETTEDIAARGLSDRRQNDRRTQFRRNEERDLISTAQAEANAIREAAQAEGFQAGLDQAKTVTEELHRAIEELHSARDRAYLSAGEDLATLAVEIAQRLIHTEISCDPDLVMSTVRHVLHQVGREHKQILIRVNPVDLKNVKQLVKTDDDIPSGVEIQVREENSVEPGSCTVETRAGFIDARFSTQLEVLKRLILTGGHA